MLKSQSFRVILLGAALALSFNMAAFAADEPPKPAADAPRSPRRNPAEDLKNYRDRFEGTNLSDDQMKKIDGLIEATESEVKGSLGKEGGEGMRAAYQAMRKLGEDVDAVLNESQKAIVRKNVALARVERYRKRYMAPELKLSDDQTKKINDIVDDLKKQVAAQTPGPDDRENMRKGFELMQASTEKINAVLTPEQQKQIPSFGRRPRGERAPGTPPQ